MQQDYGGNYLEGTAPAEKTATFVYKDEKGSKFQHSLFFDKICNLFIIF